MLSQPRPTSAPYHNDHLGTPLALSDEQGQVVAEWVRDPFGQIVSKSGTVEDNHMFPGQFWDADANLAYNWNRWYSPEVGRYVEVDPLTTIGEGLAPSLLNQPAILKELGGIDPVAFVNPFAYVDSDPLLYTDESGLKKQSTTPCILYTDPKTGKSLGLRWQTQTAPKSQCCSGFKRVYKYIQCECSKGKPIISTCNTNRVYECIDITTITL